MFTFHLLSLHTPGEPEIIRLFTQINEASLFSKIEQLKGTIEFTGFFLAIDNRSIQLFFNYDIAVFKKIVKTPLGGGN